MEIRLQASEEQHKKVCLKLQETWFTWGDHAVSVRRGWQAVCARGVVHEDWQR